MVGQRGSVCSGLPGLASEIALTHPFLRPGTSPLGADEYRRKNLSRTTSWVLVALLHVLFFFAFVIGIRPFDMKNRSVAETILVLSTAGNNQRDRETVNPIPMVNNAPRMLAPPITIPKPPPIKEEEKNPPTTGQGPVDVLGAVGRELACSAGSWEHLTSAERARCGFYPWRGVKLPNGSLVMIPRSMMPRLPDAPETEFSINSGTDRMQSDLQKGVSSAGGCPIMLNTPCLQHVSPGMRDATGQN